MDTLNTSDIKKKKKNQWLENEIKVIRKIPERLRYTIKSNMNIIMH